MFSLEMREVKQLGGGRLVGTGHDELTYQLKNQSRQRYVPLNEWLCYEIAEAAGIPVPVKRIVRYTGMGQVFGSRYLATSVRDGGLSLPSGELRNMISGAPIWRIFSLDLFLGNWDRGFDNLIFSDCDSGRCVQAIDFEKGLLAYEGMRMPDPVRGKADTATMTTARIVDSIWPLRKYHADIERVLDNIAGISADHLIGWIQSAPPAWAHGDLVEPCIDWWSGAAPASRIQRIKMALRNGELV